MSWFRHNAIVVTSWHAELMATAAAVARGMGLMVIGPSEEGINGYRSLLVCPDGSKEGWDESNEYDEKRKLFRLWLDAQANSDRSSKLEWVEVAYSQDIRRPQIVRHTLSRKRD